MGVVVEDYETKYNDGGIKTVVEWSRFQWKMSFVGNPAINSIVNQDDKNKILKIIRVPLILMEKAQKILKAINTKFKLEGV